MVSRQIVWKVILDFLHSLCLRILQVQLLLYKLHVIYLGRHECNKERHEKRRARGASRCEFGMVTLLIYISACSAPDRLLSSRIFLWFPIRDTLQSRQHHERLHFTTLGDDYVEVRSIRGSIASFGSLHLLNHVHTVDDLTKDDVLVIEERGGNSCDEELRTIGIGSSVLLICQ